MTNNVRPFPGHAGPRLVQPISGHPQGMPQGEQAPNPFRTFNPLQENAQGMQVLRKLTNCKLPEHAAKLHGLVQKISTMPDASDDLVNAAGRAIALTLRGDQFCTKQLQKRTIVKYADDPELDGLNKEIKELEHEVENAQIRVQQLMQEINDKHEKLWDITVSKFGLSADSRLYMIDKNNEEVSLVELTCSKCTGAQSAEAIVGEITMLFIDPPPPKVAKEDEPND